MAINDEILKVSDTAFNLNAPRNMSTSEMRAIKESTIRARNAEGLYSTEYVEKLNKYAFNRFANYNNMDVAVQQHAAIFMTRPDLQIENFYRYKGEYELRPEPLSFLTQNSSNYYKSSQSVMGGFLQQQKTDSLGQSNFVPIIGNNFTNFEASDTALKTDETHVSRRGVTFVQAVNQTDSNSNGDFSITFLETADHFITWFHSYWVEYSAQVKYNKFIPKDYNRINDIIDYQVSLYFFTFEPDNMTITHYVKYTGVFPKNEPFSIYSWDRGDSKILKPTITYQFVIKSENKPFILDEFNYVAGKPAKELDLLKTDQGLKDAIGKSAMLMSNNWKTRPYIYIDKKSNRHKLLYD